MNIDGSAQSLPREGEAHKAHGHMRTQTHLAAGVGEDDRLGDGQGLVQIAQRVQLPLLLLHIHVKLLDTL